MVHVPNATATPIISCFIIIQTGLLAYPGCPGKEAVRLVSVTLVLCIEVLVLPSLVLVLVSRALWSGERQWCACVRAAVT